MDIENLTENIQSVIECAKAIEYELENNSGDHDEAIQLYETLETHGITTDADEIVASVELVAELSTDDAAEINSALELWESVNSNGHDTDDIEAALEVYAIVENSSVCTSELEGSLKLVEEWDEHCAPTQMDPASMMQTLLDRCAIINVFQDTAGMPIGSVDDANVAVMVMGKATARREEDRDIEAETYATVRRCVGHLTDFGESLEILLETSVEWNKHCGGIWSTPEAMAVAYEELSKGRTVDTKEQALLDAIKAFCEPAKESTVCEPPGLSFL